MNIIRKYKNPILAIAAVLILLCGGIYLYQKNIQQKRYALAFYGMSTLVDQKAYGASAEKAMAEVQNAFVQFEEELSLYNENSDIAKINAASGKSPVKISAEAYDLLTQATQLSSISNNAFAITVAPLTLAWGITSDTPHVLSQSEIDALLPLVDDSALILENGTAFLKNEGAKIDLGGIAKGTACNLAKKIYEENGVKSALLSVGGNIYVKGKKPDGSAYRIGFRDPTKSAQTSIASITLEDEVLAVSGGYERYFEENGTRYHHILDPKTGAPASSDIVSVGIIEKDGTKADFYSTTLFVWGKEKTLAFMKNGGKVIMLDAENNLYVSRALEPSFELVETGYNVIFI